MLLKDRSNLKSLANELGNAETPHPALDLFWSVIKVAVLTFYFSQ